MVSKITTCVSALSLLLCAAAVGLWARSYRVGGLVARDVPMRGQGFRSALGRLSYERYEFLSASWPNTGDEIGKGWRHVRTTRRALRSNSEEDELWTKHLRTDTE